MIDLHIHILPGLDDGSQSMDESLEMARLAEESGVTDMAVTPHSYADEYFLEHSYQRTFDRFKEQLAKNEINLNIYQGMEVLAFSGMSKFLQEGILKTINNTKYVLVEFRFREDENKIKKYINELIENKYRPVVAHVERYEAVQDNWRLAYDIHNMGCVLQMNKGSITGNFGRRSMKTAWELLNARLINVIASDAHSSEYRTPSMGNTADIIVEEFSEEYKNILLDENPRRIINGKGIIRFEPIIPEDSKRNRFF